MTTPIPVVERAIVPPSDDYWAEKARTLLDWVIPFKTTRRGSFEDGGASWFLDGKLNACANCVDRHLDDKGDKPAIIWETDNPDESQVITYNDLFRRVCRFANVLKLAGVRENDVVTLYMPMIPESVVAILACIRIGAVHSIVFSGFSAEALVQRIQDSRSRFIVTSDYALRGGRKINIKSVVDKAMKSNLISVEKVFVAVRSPSTCVLDPKVEINMVEAMELQLPYCPCTMRDSEDTLFVIYTSGSTGKPKGVLHTTAGYMLYAQMTQQELFDCHDGDIFGCVADIGWITGHTYVVYGPLLNGITTVLFESLPNYPDAGRYWDMIQRHKITQFYTSPTAVRSVMGFGDEFPNKYDLSSLRVIGTVGEPINKEAWFWLHDVVGKGRCPIVDAYWQSESGGIIIAPNPSDPPCYQSPSSCGTPFHGIVPVLLDEHGELITERKKLGLLHIAYPWPGLCRTVINDHKQYTNLYIKHGKYYFTGDQAIWNEDGYVQIVGRADDVLKVSGHRLSVAELENAFATNDKVVECAVIGFPHQIKGEGICAYVKSKPAGPYASPIDLEMELRATVRELIGPLATPDYIIFITDLPKTRSGKIMRRVLRKLITRNEDMGDLSTLVDPDIMDDLRLCTESALNRKK